MLKIYALKIQSLNVKRTTIKLFVELITLFEHK